MQLVDQKKPHIIALCEVKPKNGSERSLQDFTISGFTCHQTNLDNNIGRGIAVLIHSSISHLVTKINQNSEFQEACLIEIYLSQKEKLLFGCFYRSPTNSFSSDENSAKLNTLIRTLALDKGYTHKCFVGDFNYNSIKWQNWTTSLNQNSKEEKFLEALRDSYLYQHVKEPTRSRGMDEPSTLDLIFTNEDSQVHQLDHCSPLGKSDHCVLSFSFQCYIDFVVPTTRFRYESGDFNAMRHYVMRHNCFKDISNTPLGNQNDVNLLWNKFKDVLLSLRNSFIPNRNSNKHLWKDKGRTPLSKDLRNKIKEKKRLQRKWFNASDQIIRSNFRIQYTIVRNDVKRMLRQEKKDFERKICNQSNENPKAFWSYIRSNLKTRTGVYPLLQIKDDPTSLKVDDREKADILQKQFCSVFTQEPDGEVPFFAERTNAKIEELNITGEMIRAEISKLNQNKSCGPDEIHPIILKKLSDFIIEPLMTIMNSSLRSGILPDDWKQATVSPIYKKGPKNQPSNYRPVSLTSIICKMMESILTKTMIMPHLMRENLLSNKQYGFIPGRSTTTQLLHYLDSCAEAIADGDVIDIIYFDFAKAFDTVPHRRLLKKIESYGIHGNILKWINGFLSNRRQTVKVNGVASKQEVVRSGIPQGSVLGPLLFVIYINDLPEHVISQMYLFADDTKLMKKVRTRNDSVLLQNDMDGMQNWSNTWLLNFHPDKCHVLTLGKLHNIKHAHNYRLGDTELEHVFNEKDLGVVIDSDLSFKDHIAEKIRKANSIVGLIYRSFDHLSPKLLRQLYVTFVRPILEYAQAAWSPVLRKHVNNIENVQRRATRLIDGYKNLTYSDRLVSLDLPSLEYRRIVNDMVEIYKHIHVYDPATIRNKLVMRTRPNRKHEFQIIPNFAKDGVRGVQSKSFFYRCINTWNDLPKEVVNATSIQSFKRRLDQAWRNHPLRFGQQFL